MFGERKQNAKARPSDLGMLTSTMGIAIWKAQNGQQNSLDLRIGPAFQPRGGSLVVRSTFPAYQFPEFCHGVRAAGEILGNTTELLPDDVREMLRRYSAALDTALNDVDSSPMPFKGIGNGVFNGQC